MKNGYFVALNLSDIASAFSDISGAVSQTPEGALGQAMALADDPSKVVPLRILKAQLSDRNELLRCDGVMFDAVVPFGETGCLNYQPVPNTEENRAVLKDVIGRYGDEITKQLNPIRERALDFCIGRVEMNDRWKHLRFVAGYAPDK